MTHIYKAVKGATMKVGAIPVTLTEDTMFESETDLIDIDADIEYCDFYEMMNGEWFMLQMEKEAREL